VGEGLAGTLLPLGHLTPGSGGWKPRLASVPGAAVPEQGVLVPRWRSAALKLKKNGNSSRHLLGELSCLSGVFFSLPAELFKSNC